MQKGTFTITFSKKQAAVVAALALFTFLRLLLGLRLPVFIMADQDYDDIHLITMSLNLLKMQWLGEYSLLTLSKNLGYSFFLAFCYLTMIPYGLMLAALNCLSAGLFCRALKPAASGRFRFIFYLLMIYSPVGFTTLISQRVYRNAVLPYAVLLVFAGYTALFLRKDRPAGKLLPWGIVTGLSLTFFWFIKEDSIWILPFVLVISLLMLVWLFLFKRQDGQIVKKAGLLVLPFLCIAAVTLVISTINYACYGVFAANDRSGTEFADMAANLFSIEDDTEHDDRIWVTRAMLEDAYEASPTFATLRDVMNEDTSWTGEDGEIAGDYIIWQIRYAMFYNDLYSSGAAANDFAAQVNRELEEAFANGTLKRDSKIHVTAQMKGMEIGDILSCVPDTAQALARLASYRDCGIDECNSTGKQIAIRRVETFLAANAEYLSTETDPETGELIPDPAIRQHSYPRAVANALVRVYQKLSALATPLAFFAFAVYTVLMLLETARGNLRKWNLFWILAGTILSAFLVELEVQLFTSFFEEEMHEQFLAFYSASAFPLLQVFKYLSIYALGSSLWTYVQPHVQKHMPKGTGK